MFVEPEDMGALRRERSCPVCYHGSLPGWYRMNHPTFTVMMRHWEMMHPKALPGAGGVSSNGNCRILRLPLEKVAEVNRLVAQEDVDRWATDQEAHVPEVRAMWDALGYVEGVDGIAG